MNHMQSLKFEHKLYSSVKLKMEEMQQHNMSWIEVGVMTVLKFSNTNSVEMKSTILTFHFTIASEFFSNLYQAKAPISEHFPIRILQA